MGPDKRLEYAGSFQNGYFFRLLYYAGTQYPIHKGSKLRHTHRDPHMHSIKFYMFSKFYLLKKNALCSYKSPISNY